ncbi:dNTP triphosphohydrolase [Patescibacteria group bacterium]|nr:dNTP triphosphohydrolase [Patescibacteria group bacterium]
MESLTTRLKAANSLLAPYAIPNQGLLGRKHNEPEDETRFPFQRDRDRIIHTRSFRRLKGKTQVFVEGGGDHYRTRLTHTMEVAQISRDVARTLELNEDLTECIALAHDLGHPPFGHAGESALNEWMQACDMSFEHNEQSYRIVTLLEEHSSLAQGLNLNQEVLEGLLKHSTPHDSPTPKLPHAPSLEAQVVNIADEIAYTGHDCEDGLRAKLFSIDDLYQTSLAKRAHERTQERGTSLRGSIIHILVTDLYEATFSELSSQCINTIDDVYAAQTPLVNFSQPLRDELDQLREFLSEKMYFSQLVLERSREGQRVILNLCNSLKKNPSDKVKELQKRTQGSLEEAIKDYVAGMTDSYAIERSSK